MSLLEEATESEHKYMYKNRNLGIDPHYSLVIIEIFNHWINQNAVKYNI